MRHYSTKRIYNKAAGKRDLFRDPKRKAKEHRETVCGYDIIFFVFPYHMATADKVFMNDNFSAFVLYEDSEQTDAICAAMAWSRAFKRFGLSTEDDPSVYQIVKKEANQKLRICL